jgi:probable O-glycosylation ligase (exosortase A-associated)
MRDLLLLGLVLVAAGIALRRPAFGMLTFTFLGFLFPQSYTWSFARTFPFSQVIAVSTMLGLLLSPERKQLPMQRETVLLILLWAVMGFSTIFALFPADAFQRLVYVSKIFLMTLVALIVIKTEVDLHMLVKVIGFCLGFYALKAGVFAFTSGGGEFVYGPEGSFLEANNSIGLALAMNIPILLYLLKRERLGWVRWSLRAMLFLTYPAIVTTYSRGAWLGMVMATGLSLVKSRKKFLMIPVAGILIVMLQAVIPQIAPDRLVKRYGQLVEYQEEGSAESRFWNWEFCKRVGFARPLTGGGFDFYSPQMYAIYYPEFNQRWGEGKVWSCHSTWLTVFGEHGIPGFLLWLGLLVCCFSSLRQIRAYGRTNPAESHYVQYADMVQSCIATYLVIGTFLDAAYFDFFYYLIAITIILKHLIVANAQKVGSIAEARAIAPSASVRNPVVAHR